MSIEIFSCDEAQVEVEMATLYITEQYCVVKVDGEALRVDFPDSSGKKERGKVVRVPLAKVDQVFVIGESTCTTPALQVLMERGIVVHYLSVFGRSYGSLVGNPSKNAQVRLAQYAVHTDYARRFGVARQCVMGKLSNMRTLLMRYARERKDESSGSLKEAAQNIQTYLQQLAAAEPRSTYDPSDRMHGMGLLFGLEGSGSQAYYGVFGLLLKHGWSFAGRTRRPPTDPVNALLSLGYAILTNQVMAQICAVGLDPGIGMLHRPGAGKPALALDLVEEFRPIVVDSVVLSVINGRQLSQDDVEQEMAGAWRLKDDARKLFVQKLEERLSSEVQHPVFGYKTSYRRCMALQARLFAKYAQGEIEQYVPFVVR